MKILYKQPSSINPDHTLLCSFGIDQCYFKHIFTERDQKVISLKPHYHRGYEIHMVEQGVLLYEADGTVFSLNCGQFLLLPPQKQHRVLHRAPNTSTFSISFGLTEGNSPLGTIDSCAFGQISPRIWENIQQIRAEYDNSLELSNSLIAGNVLEILVLLWRLSGRAEAVVSLKLPDEDLRLTLAKQYIHDNIENPLSVYEVSSYCHLSTKQLTRLFQQGEKQTLAAYIKTQRIHHMEKLLREDGLSLKDISERMNCSSEYYFNTFFKKNAGMTPGKYRAIHQQD